MMLRPRYMIFGSELFNTLPAAASGFDGSARMICIRPSNAGSVFACLKYCLLIWTGSTAGESLSLAMPVKAADKATNNARSASSAAVCAAVCVVRFAEPTAPAAVAAAPVRILRRVKPVMNSSWSCSRGRTAPAARQRSSSGALRLLQDEGEIRRGRRHVLGGRITVTRHAARRRQRDAALTVGFECRVRQVGRGWRACRIDHSHQVLLRLFQVLYLPDTVAVAGPLSREQHVVFPNHAFEKALERRVELRHFVDDRAWQHSRPDHLASIRTFECQRRVGVPRLRRRVVDGRTVVCAFGVEEIVSIQLLLDAAVRRLVRYIADVLEGGPYPLRGEAGFVTDVEPHQPEFFLDAGRTGRGRGRAREIDQGVGGVEFVDEVLVLFRIEDSVGDLEHDRAHPSRLRFLPCDRIVSRWKTDRAVELLLALSAVQTVLDDEIVHRPVHQDVEQRKVAVLIDQRTGLERLVERLFPEMEDDLVRAVQPLALRREDARAPGRLGALGQHDVPERPKVRQVFPLGEGVAAGPRALADRFAVAGGVHGDESKP